MSGLETVQRLLDSGKQRWHKSIRIFHSEYSVVVMPEVQVPVTDGLDQGSPSPGPRGSSIRPPSIHSKS